MEKRFVYADNAATTPVTPAVLEAMTPWLMENYGNPSSIYSIGRAARTAVEKARRSGDPARLVASSEKAQSTLGWQPRYSALNTILQTAWNWHRSHPKGF